MAGTRRSRKPEKITSLSQLAERLRERVRERIASGDYTPGHPAVPDLSSYATESIPDGEHQIDVFNTKP